MEDKKHIGERAVHICDLASENKFEEVKKLAQEPEFMCFGCEWAAHIKENLCYPKSHYEMLGTMSLE